MTLKPEQVIEYVLMSEKAMDAADKENKMTFIVNRNANKNQIKEAVEKLHAVKVESVNVQITMKGKKKATVKLSPEHHAEEIVAEMGVI